MKKNRVENSHTGRLIMNKFLTVTFFLSLMLSNLFSKDLAQNSSEFEKIVLDSNFRAEGASSCDIDGDGIIDIVAHPYWYKGPDYKLKFLYTDIDTVPVDGADKWTNHNFAWCYDFDSDGHLDILEAGKPGSNATWFRNPTNPKIKLKWDSFNMAHWVTNESPHFTDLDGDGKPEIVSMQGGKGLGFYKAQSDPTQEWIWHPLPTETFGDYTHGLGVGDVNGDGKKDIVIKDGVWLQGKSIDSDWKFIPFSFFDKGGAQYYVYDFDGDGDADIVGSEEAHGWGLAWWEQVPSGKDFTFIEHKFMGNREEESKYGVAFSQPHAIGFGDMDGDGLPDIVTGKRHFAHLTTGDPEPMGAAVLYWFKYSLVNKVVTWTPHLIDSSSGVGTQVHLADLNGDGRLDIVISNKSGTFLFLNKMGKATEIKKAKNQNKQPNRNSLTTFFSNGIGRVRNLLGRAFNQ